MIGYVNIFKNKKNKLISFRIGNAKSDDIGKSDAIHVLENYFVLDDRSSMYKWGFEHTFFSSFFSLFNTLIFFTKIEYL